MNRIRVSLLFFVRGCRYALLPLCIAIVLLCCDGRFVNDVWAEGDTTETYVATTYEELTEEVRSQIIARNAAFTVLYDTSDPDDIYQAATYAIEHAFDETDDPRSGPYLEFHVRNLDYNGYETVVGDEAATYYELSFECSCLSTAEQEAAVDAFVSEWIAEHDYSDPCDTLIRIAYLFQGLTGVNVDATVYETFFDKNGCGEGVARAVQRLCKEAGISCVCTGAISQGTIIDYNLVELDGLYYIFDVVRNAMLKGSGSELCRVVYPVSDEYPMAYNDYVRDIDYTFDETTGTLTINSDILDFYVDATEGYNPETGIYEYLVDLRPWAPIQTQIRKIVMTDNVKYMGEFAFACQVQAEEYFFNAMPLLTEVVIGGGITKIGNRAFNEIPALERVSGGEGVTRVGYYAFWNCTNLQAVDFLSNLISVREYAFAYCSSLVAAEPFSQLDIVGEGSFAYCSSLTNLVLPQEMTSIDRVAFAYTCVENFQIPRYIDRVGEEAFHSMQVGESSGTLTLPADWVNTELDLSVFSNCNFTTLIVEEGWEVLGSSIFYHTPFKTLFLPKGLTDIDGAMICNPDGSMSCVETFVFAGTSDEWLSEGHSSIFEYNVSFFFEETSLDATWRYENGTLHISGNGALAGHLSCEERPWNQYADSITRVIVEDGVTGLGSYCCANMPNLIEVQLPSSLKTINWRCFENSSNIVSLQLPDGLRYIYEYAFHNMNKLETLHIPSGVRFVGSYALLGCDALTEITLPGFRMVDRAGGSTAAKIRAIDNVSLGGFFNPVNGYVNYASDLDDIPTGLSKVTICQADQIPQNAFRSMSMLREIVLPDTYTIICAEAFSGTSITEITLPDCLTVIGEQALRGTNITKLTLPDCLTTIGANAFAGTPLTELVIPDSVTTFGEGCFSSLWQLQTLQLPAGMTEIPNRMAASCTSLTSLVLPDTVVSIGESAFTGCTSLAKINFPEACRSMGKLAFYPCPALHSITLPDDMQTVGTQGNDTTVRFCCSMGSTTAQLLSKSDTPFYVTDCYYRYEYDSSGNELGMQIYRYEGTETEIVLPDNVLRILKGAYSNHPQLETIVLPEGLFQIGDMAFAGCSSLREIVLPESLAYVGDGVFYSCTSLTDVYLPDNIVAFGGGNSSVLRLWCTYDSTTAMTLAWYNFTIYDQGFGFYYIKGSDGSYTGVELTDYVGMEPVVHVPEYATSLTCIFSGNTSIVEVYLPQSVTNIGAAAFAGCTSLTTIHLPDTVTTIASTAFAGCTLLELEYLPAGLLSLDVSAFESCPLIECLVVPDDCTVQGVNENVKLYCTIGSTAAMTASNPSSVRIEGGFYTQDGNYYRYMDSKGNSLAFMKCNPEIEACTIAEGTTSIYKSAFSNYESLMSVAIPNTVTSIGDSAFIGCKSLTGVSIPESVTSIGNSAFRACGLTSIDLPESVTSIGDYTFWQCYNLVNVNLPQGIRSIGSYAFANCYGLTDIVIPGGVTSIGSNAFRACRTLSSLTIPDGVKSIGSEAFYNCYRLTSVELPNSVTTIGNNAFGCDDGYRDDFITFLVYENSYAHTWCEENGQVYKLIHDHVWDKGVYIIEQTCTESGEMLFTCQICGETKTEIVPPHHWCNGVLTTWPADEPGEMSYECLYCEEVKLAPVTYGTPGDANEDELVDMLDIISLMEWYCGGAIELNIANGEVTGEGIVDMLDIIRLMEWYCGTGEPLYDYAEEVVE